MNIIKKEFISFLESEGIKEEFEQGLESTGWHNLSLDEYTAVTSQYDLISEAFDWRYDSFIPGDFWNRLDNKWNKHLDKTKRNVLFY